MINGCLVATGGATGEMGAVAGSGGLDSGGDGVGAARGGDGGAVAAVDGGQLAAERAALGRPQRRLPPPTLAERRRHRRQARAVEVVLWSDQLNKDEEAIEEKKSAFGGHRFEPALHCITLHYIALHCALPDYTVYYTLCTALIHT